MYKILMDGIIAEQSLCLSHTDWKGLSSRQRLELSQAAWAVEYHVSASAFKVAFLGLEAAVRYENSDLTLGRRLTTAELAISPLWLALSALFRRLDVEHAPT